MNRKLAVCFAVAFFASPVAALANSVDAMFPVKKHDFGTVAVASKTEFRFPIHNNTNRPIRIQTVRTSCGCTTPTVETPYIEPGQTGSILAKFNTGTHRGQKGATLTVVIDQPFYSEVRLRVDGYIRQDLVFHPGAVDFGKQSVGQELSQAAKLLYAGRSDWAVVEVLGSKPWVSADLKLEARNGGNATYVLTVTIGPGAPAGPFREELVLVTNDRSRPRVPFLISGELESDLTVSPQSIAAGTVKPGETVEKKLVIRGKEPFLIESIEAKGWQIAFDPVTEPKTTHIIAVRLNADGETTGQLSGPIVVKTNGGLTTQATATLTGIVRAE
jgi:hypothetical protein